MRISSIRRMALVSPVVLLLSACLLNQWIAAVAASNKDQKSEPIKIGFVTTLSGAVAAAGKQMANGIELYVDQVHGKMAGRPVEVIVANDEGSPAGAVAQVHKLVEQDKVKILAGTLLANIGYGVAPVVDQLQVPMLYPISAGDDLTKRKRHAWIIRDGWSCSQPSHAFGEWVYKHLGYRKIVTFAMDYPFGYECVGGFQKTFEEAGGQVVQKIWVPLGFTDFSSAIKKIRKDADAVFLVTVGASCSIIPKQFKELGMTLPVLGGVTTFDESYLPDIGNDVLGCISASIYSGALDTPANKRFAAAYRAKYNEEPNYYAESCYTTGMWIDKALQALKGDASDKNKLLSELKRVELKDAPRGPLRMDAYGNPIENVYIRKVAKSNTGFQNTVIDTIPAVSQFWHYKPKEFLKQPPYTKDYPPCTHCQKE